MILKKMECQTGIVQDDTWFFEGHVMNEALGELQVHLIAEYPRQ